MKTRMKKILLLTICFCLFLLPIVNVFSYDYINEKNKTSIEFKRDEIYSLREMYQYIMGTSGDNIIGNYTGVCSMVTVEGSGIYSLDEYVAGVVKHEIGSEADNPELLKAQAVAARSFVIASRGDRLDCTVSNSQSFQTFSEVDPNNASDRPFIEAAEATSGEVVMRDGKVALTQYISYPNAVFCSEVNGKWIVKFQKFADDSSTAWTWEGPPKAEVLAANNWAANTGAPSTSHHFGMSQTIAGWMARNGKTYKQIIETFYGTNNASLSKLPDSVYDGNIEYVDSEFGNIIYWNQTDYKTDYYSKDVKVASIRSDNGWATISSHGCGPTSLAIVLSSFRQTPITPQTVTQQVCQSGGCYSSGTSWDGLKVVAQSYGYKTEQIWSSANYPKVISALSSKNSLVIALMGPGEFTRGGHYIVLTGTSSDGKVSVADPASRQRTQKKWYSFSLVTSQAKGFLIITK